MGILRKAITTFCILLNTLAVYGQWNQVNTNTDIFLNDVYFPDSLKGYCVGGRFGSLGSNKGAILETIDGGNNWNFIYNDSMLAITHIGAINDTIICFGNKNAVSIRLTSTDRGISWTVDTLSYIIVDVQFFDDNLYILDGLRSLSKVNINGASQVIQTNIAFFDVHLSGIVAMGINADTIYKSIDFGNSWLSIPIYYEEIKFNSNSFSHAQVKLFNDTIIVYATYPSVISYSYNNGMDWTYNFLTDKGSIAIYSPQKIYSLTLDTINPNIGLVVLSTNQGESWQNQNPANRLNMDISDASFYFIDENTGFVFGKNGRMYKTFKSIGFKENSPLKKKVNIFPNPTKKIIHIKTEGSIHFTSLTLINNQGKKIKEYKRDERVLNLTDLPSGIYFLNIQSEKGEVTEKIILE